MAFNQTKKKMHRTQCAHYHLVPAQQEFNSISPLLILQSDNLYSHINREPSRKQNGTNIL